MDGPNVNLKVLNNLETKLKQTNSPSITPEQFVMATDK